MLDYRKTVEKNVTSYFITLFRIFRISLLDTTIKGAHITIDFTIHKYGVSFSLNSWELN